MQPITASLVMVYVSDMDRAIDFYINKLGFTEKIRYGNDWAEINAPGLIIALHPLRDQKINFSYNMQIGFAVDDINASIELLKSRGVKIEYYKDSAVHLAPFTDDDGNQMYLYAPQ